MASTYPTSLDAFTNPTSSDLLTSPSHSQQHSDINDAMEAVQTKLAIGNTVIGTYTAYTPTTSGLIVGDGTFNTKYCRVNNFVHWYGLFTFGSTSSTAYGWSFDLPITADTPIGKMPVGTGMAEDISTGLVYPAIHLLESTAKVALQGIFADTTAPRTRPIGSFPFVAATGDKYYFNLYYKAA